MVAWVAEINLHGFAEVYFLESHLGFLGFFTYRPFDGHIHLDPASPQGTRLFVLGSHGRLFALDLHFQVYIAEMQLFARHDIVKAGGAFAGGRHVGPELFLEVNLAFQGHERPVHKLVRLHGLADLFAKNRGKFADRQRGLNLMEINKPGIEGVADLPFSLSLSGNHPHVRSPDFP